MLTFRVSKARPALALAVASLALVACGSDDDGGGGTGNGAASADVAAAKKTLAPYSGQPSEFPVEQPLEEKPPAGTTFSYLQCVTPICGLFAQILPPAAKTMGVQLKTTKAGASTQELQGALDTIISGQPAAVILPAVEPGQINTKLSELDQREIPAISNGIIDHEKYEIDSAIVNTRTAEIAG